MNVQLALVSILTLSASPAFSRQQVIDPGGGTINPGPPWTNAYDPSNWTITYAYSWSSVSNGWWPNSITGIDKAYSKAHSATYPTTTTTPPDLTPEYLRPQNYTYNSHPVSSTFQGTYTATLTWRWPLSQHQPPTVIFAKETASARYSFTGGPGSGNADNGIGSQLVVTLPDPLSLNSEVGLASGHRLKKLTVPANGIVVLDQVTVSASASCTGPRVDSTATGDYSVSVESKAVEIASSLAPTYHKKDNGGGSDGTSEENYRRSDGTIEIDVATSTTTVGSLLGVCVPSSINAVKYGIWNNPYHEWNAFSRQYSDTLLSEMTSIPVHEDLIWSGSEGEYSTYLASKIKGTLSLTDTVKLSVTDDGGSGVKAENTADVRIHLPMENATSENKVKKTGTWKKASPTYLNPFATQWTATAKMMATISVSVGVNGTLKVPIKAVELAFGVSLQGTCSLTLESDLPVPLEAGQSGCVVIAEQWNEWTLKHDAYNPDGFLGIRRPLVKSTESGQPVLLPIDYILSPKVWMTGNDPVNWAP